MTNSSNFIRSLLYGCLTAAVATFIAHQASARPFIEDSTYTTLPWSTSSESLAARLYQGFFLLERESLTSPELFPPGSVERTGDKLTLSESRSKLSCEALVRNDDAERQPVYRCSFDVKSRDLKWNSNRMSLAARLYDALNLLSNRASDAKGLLVRETAEGRIVKLTDQESASFVACQRRTLNGQSNQFETRCRIQPVP